MYAARRIFDSWVDWKIKCHSTFLIDDVKGVYIIGLLIGFLQIGGGGYLGYAEIWKVSRVFQALLKLPDLCDGICQAVNTHTFGFQSLIYRCSHMCIQHVTASDTHHPKLIAFAGSFSLYFSPLTSS